MQRSLAVVFTLLAIASVVWSVNEFSHGRYWTGGFLAVLTVSFVTMAIEAVLYLCGRARTPPRFDAWGR
jgi:multisubunit Na+/H+ antiporter MnhG subunit